MVVRKMKEKCKDAARMRREKERAEFVELSKLLPLPSSTTSQLDKASIIRLTSSYLRMRSAFPEGLGENWGHKNLLKPQRLVSMNDELRLNLKSQEMTCLRQQMNQVRELGSLLLQTLDGFVFALHKDGKIMYISETASVHLGLPQIDLTGSSIFEYVHPSDHNDIYATLGLSDSDQAQLEQARPNEGVGDEHQELGRSFCMRMKCILPKRNAGLVSSGYKAIHCNGYLKVRRKSSSTIATIQNKETQQHQPVNSQQQQNYCPDWESYALVAVGHSLLPTASTEVKLTGSSFMFRATLDLKIYYIEAPVIKFLGFDQMEVIGQSLYQFVHVNDTQTLENSHRSLLDKGQVVTKYYRLMKRDGGFIWVQSYATIVNNLRSMPKPHHIVSICFVLAENPLDQSAIINQKSQRDHRNNKSDDLSLLISSAPEQTNKSVASSGYDSASSVGHRDDAETRSMKSQKRDKYSAQKKLRKLRTSRGAVINKTVSPTTSISPGSRTTKTTNAKSLPAAAAAATTTCSHCRLSYLLCTCARQTGLANQSTYTEPIVIGPNRRSSEDTCSIVSSVASTSISSVASSHQGSEFISCYTSLDSTGYQANSCLDSSTTSMSHCYLDSDSALNSKQNQNMLEPLQVASTYPNYDQTRLQQAITVNDQPNLVQCCKDTPESRGQQIWLTAHNGHFVTDYEPHMDESNVTTTFHQQTCNNLPQSVYFQSSPEWFSHSGHSINHSHMNPNQMQQSNVVDYCQGVDERIGNYSDTPTSSLYHESPLYPSISIGSTFRYHPTVTDNRYTMSSSSG